MSRAYKGLSISKKKICKNDTQLGVGLDSSKLHSMAIRDRIRLFQSIQKSNNQIIDYFIREQQLEESRAFIEEPETPLDSDEDREEGVELDEQQTQLNPDE